MLNDYLKESLWRNFLKTIDSNWKKYYHGYISNDKDSALIHRISQRKTQSFLLSNRKEVNIKEK